MSTRESEPGLHDENLALTARLGRIGPALERMARELASSRRELGALSAENASLREQLAVLRPGATGAPTRVQTDERRAAIELTGSWCPHCGLTVDADAIRQERAILAARCCPRCDGRLLARHGTPPLRRETSVFLG